MSQTKFKTSVRKIGNLASGLLKNNYLVLFDDNNEDFASVFGFSVDHADLIEDINNNDVVVIDGQEYKILDISENTNENLKNETHVAFHIDREFDGPKQILLEGESFPELKEGSEIIIKKGS